MEKPVTSIWKELDKKARRYVADALTRSVITPHGGFCFSGDEAAVIASVFRHAGKKMDVAVVCKGHLSRPVDWDGLPIFICPAENDCSVINVKRLDSRGRAVFHDLPEGKYVFRVSKEGWGFGLLPTADKNKSPLSETYETRDQSICVTVTHDKYDNYKISAETDDRVKVDKSLLVAILEFEPEGEGIKYVSKWQSEAEVSRTCTVKIRQRGKQVSAVAKKEAERPPLRLAAKGLKRRKIIFCFPRQRRG